MPHPLSIGINILLENQLFMLLAIKIWVASAHRSDEGFVGYAEAPQQE